MRIVGRPGGDAASERPRRRGAGAGDSSGPWEQAEQRRSNGWRARIADQQAQVNVAALADRVMQQIDDRLHAWHERTGF
jgi:hypothetical protein